MKVTGFGFSRNASGRERSASLFALFLSVSLLAACATGAHEMTRNIVEGNDAALRGDFAGSIGHYESALASVPDSAPAKRNLGIVLVKEIGRAHV